jgi:hypothetical protein
MKIDQLLNKRLFKLFGFPIYGWVLLMGSIFAISYFGGKAYLDFAKEQDAIHSLRGSIDILKAEHKKRLDLMHENYNKAKAYKSEVSVLNIMPSVDIEKFKATENDVKPGDDNELKKLRLYQSQLEIDIQKVINKDKEIAYWLVTNVPEIGAKALNRKDTLFVNSKK